MDDRGVAEADVDRGRARDPVRGAAQHVEAVVARGLRARLHVGLVDLHDVGAGGEQVQDLAAHGVGVGHPDRLRRAVVVVLGLLGHRERAGDGDLDRPARVRAQELDVADLDRMLARDRADHPRHRVRVPAAVQRGARVVDVDALERGGEAVRVALAAHLAVGDDVQPGALLVGDRQPRRVVLRLLEIARIDPPQLRRPHARREAPAQLLAVDQPVRLRVGADEAGEDPVRHRRRVSHTAQAAGTTSKSSATRSTYSPGSAPGSASAGTRYEPLQVSPGSAMSVNAPVCRYMQSWGNLRAVPSGQLVGEALADRRCRDEIEAGRADVLDAQRHRSPQPGPDRRRRRLPQRRAERPAQARYRRDRRL